MAQDEKHAPTCPGCHFGCALDDFQCGRGEQFFQKWEAGEELPVRRGPGSVKPPDNMPKPTGDDKLMHFLHILEIALGDVERTCAANEADHRVLDCLTRQGKAASPRIVAGRTHLGPDELQAALDELVAQEWAVSRTAHADTTLYELTDRGIAQAETWERERKQAEASFLSALTDDEKAQMTDLVLKLLEPGFKRMREGRRP